MQMSDEFKCLSLALFLVHQLPMMSFCDKRNHKMDKRVHFKAQIKLDSFKVETQSAICYNDAVLCRPKISHKDKER